MRLIAIILFAACGSHEVETPSSREVASPNEVAGEGSPLRSQVLPMDPAGAPVVELRSMKDEEVTLRVRVPGPEAVELRRAVRIEHQSGGNWRSVDASYTLRPGCDAPRGACLTLAAGAELTAPAVSSSAGQCNSESDGERLAPGHYRFVIESCAPQGTRAYQVESPFTIEP